MAARIKLFKRTSAWAIFLSMAVLFSLAQGFANAAIDTTALASAHLQFSDEPSDSDIFQARVFDEPLIPLPAKSNADENKALAKALVGYASRTNLDDFSTLTAFLHKNPDSRWNASLLLHLGLEYYNSGYYTRALAAYEQAWSLFQKVSTGSAKSQADRALGHLSQMYARLGRMQELGTLIDAVKSRELTGPAVSLMSASQEAIWMMQNRPGVCFRCGPLALERIRTYKDPAKAWHPLIRDSQSPTNGFSLDQVAQLSRDLGMNFQMAFRSQGAPFVVPAVVHWKSDHYAAIVDRDGDRFLVQDNTFHSSLWMTAAALEQESSGYFLIPPGTLSSGWRSLGSNEAPNVRGKGLTNNKDNNSTTKNDQCSGGSCDSCHGMPVYSMNTLLVSLTLKDTPEGYAPPVGPPVFFEAEYHELEANQPATFYYSNLGPKWTCNWIAYITDNPMSPNADVSYYVDGGGTFQFTGFNTNTQSFGIELMSQASLLKTSLSTYEMRFKDGSKKVFEQSDGSVGSSRKVFLSRVYDASGNFLQLNYGTNVFTATVYSGVNGGPGNSIITNSVYPVITTIVDSLGQVTTFSYTNYVYQEYCPTCGPGQYAFGFNTFISSVQDPFGRTAYFQYDGFKLTGMTDILGLSTSFVYGNNDFISSMTTPYGTTTFTTGGSGNGQWLEAADPLGQTERLEFNQWDVAPPLATDAPRGMAVVNNFLADRDSYFWDHKACAEAYRDYTKAHVYHFCHDINGASAGRIVESEIKALERRVWYDHQAQISPSTLNAGMTAQPSVIGRVLDDGTSQLYAYAYNFLGNITNSVDPVGRTFSYIYDTNGVDLLETRMTHNGKNELLGRTVYNAQHKPLFVTDASGQTTTNTYNTRGQLLATINPKNETNSYIYDTNGYLQTITGPLQTTNDVTSFTYDAFGRVRTFTDTEGYTLTYDYDALDRPTRITFPDQTYEQKVYDRLDLAATRDRLGRWTTNTYNAIRQMTSTLDPLNRLTQYGWCHCGAMTSLIDPMGRETTWDYDIQGRLKTKRYVDGSTVEYNYEDTTSRLRSKRDEKGQIKYLEYYPDNNIKRLSYPNALIATPTVTFTYDPDYNRVLTMQDGIGTTANTYNPITPNPLLGAGKLISVNGPLPNSLVTYKYDQLARVTNRAINGVAQATTFDSLGRTSVVTNALGAFQYGYVNATSRLASEVYPNGQTNLYTYYHNVGDERLEQILHLKPDGSLLSSFGYAYDSSGQITFWTNQLDTSPGRYWVLKGDSANQLTNAVLRDGSKVIDSRTYVYDLAGNRLLEQTLNATNQFTYNALNQLIAGPVGTTNASYEWDAENRLTAINQGANRSEFSYDGVGRRVEIVEKKNGSVMTNNYFLWCGNTICEVRDGAITLRRLQPQGEALTSITGTTNYFYTKDHLGSIREAVDTNGVIVTRYDYDPYGRMNIMADALKPTFAFSGHFDHYVSGFYLTLYRPLNSATARWMSRDPLGETQGLNLYSYVSNAPIRNIDPYGLFIVFANCGANVATSGLTGNGVASSGDFGTAYDSSTGQSFNYSSHGCGNHGLGAYASFGCNVGFFTGSKDSFLSSSTQTTGVVLGQSATVTQSGNDWGLAIGSPGGLTFGLGSSTQTTTSAPLP